MNDVNDQPSIIHDYQINVTDVQNPLSLSLDERTNGFPDIPTARTGMITPKCYVPTTPSISCSTSINTPSHNEIN